MYSCWTCGTPNRHFCFSCPSCQAVTQLKGLRRDIAASSASSDALLEKHFQNLKAQNENIATILEWGFADIKWELQQQTAVLVSIDHTLKNRRQTEANELRQMGETARERGSLVKAEEYFRDSLKHSDLDYRTHVGVALTYLEMNRPDEAKACLQESLRHAPDSLNKSISYRLLGRTAASEDDYGTAVQMLEYAIRESPSYVEGHYDYAQYAARMGQFPASVGSLEVAIKCRSLYWYLAQKEQNLRPLKGWLKDLLIKMREEQRQMALHCIQACEAELHRAEQIIEEAQRSVKSFAVSSSLPVITTIQTARANVAALKTNAGSNDYTTILTAQESAKQLGATLSRAQSEAVSLKKEVNEAVNNSVRGAFFGLLLVFLLPIENPLVLFGYFIAVAAIRAACETVLKTLGQEASQSELILLSLCLFFGLAFAFGAASSWRTERRRISELVRKK